MHLFRQKLENCLPIPVDRSCHNVIGSPEATYERHWWIRETYNAIVWTPLSSLDFSTEDLSLSILYGQAEAGVMVMHLVGGCGKYWQQTLLALTPAFPTDVS